MINQNIYDDIAHDYRYWEDPADEFREGEGNLLPLWKFQYDKTKKMNVTDILFNRVTMISLPSALDRVSCWKPNKFV